MDVDLPNGFRTQVDEADWLGQNLALYTWYARGRHDGKRYVVAKLWDYAAKKQKTLWLHRLILDAQTGQFVDHVNGDTLDNRRPNLRLCTNAENQQNSGPRKGTSRFKGVSWINKRGKWRVSFNWQGQTYFCGYFADEVEAAKEYNRRASELCGGFARLNKMTD